MKIQVNQLRTQLSSISLCYLFFTILISCKETNDKRIIIDDETKIKCEFSYKGDKKNGGYRCFYADGEIKEEGYYVNNLKDGVVKEYYKNGKMKSQSNYKDGDMDGLYTSFYSDGKIYGKVRYSKGIRKGYYERFDSITQNLILRVEYIKTPKEQVGYKYEDYVNRIWSYIDGDTNFISVNSDIYSIKSNTEKDGIIIKTHFANNYSGEKDGIDKVVLSMGKVDYQDVVSLDYKGKKKVEYEYKYKPIDIEEGWVYGVIIGKDTYLKSIKEDSSAVYVENRRLYFKWSIENEKVINE